MYIETERLVIKDLILNDADNLYLILSDDAVMQYLEPVYDYEKTVDFIKTCALCAPPQIYGVFTRKNGAMIGHLIFHPYDEESYELGWVIAKQHWNNGFAQELTESIITFAKHNRIPKIVIECDYRQIVTKHIAEKYHFRFLCNKDNLSVYVLSLERLALYVPKLDELDYRQRIMSDPETMAYNKGYDLDFSGYHKDTGCMDFPKSEWREWYGYFIGNEPECFYAYIVRQEDNTFIGEVNIHKNGDGYYDMGIVIEAKHRGNGYAKEALNLLLQYAFETLKVTAIYNNFEEERSAAMKLHLDGGFREVKRENGILYYMITAEEYRERLVRKVMNCKLIIPTAEYASEIIEYRREMLTAGSSFDGTSSLKEYDDPAKWLEYNRQFAMKETVPEGLVQATQFVYIRESDHKIVGMINVRHYFNDYLEKYGGHIGYSVRPSERRKGYAKQMLQETLAFCKELGLSRVLITCYTDNEASRRTILFVGGIYESTVKDLDSDKFIERYWITIP